MEALSMDMFSSLAVGLTTALTVSLLPALLILIIGIVIIKLVNKILKAALAKTKLEKAAHSLIISVVNVAMYIVLGLIVATKLGIDVTSIVALASVLTLALSLALQNMVSNVIGGFIILSTTPFHSGDYVEIAGQAGTVSEINMSYTKLTTPDGKLISIPNSAVVAAQIVNYSAEPVRRVDVAVSASYECPVRCRHRGQGPGRSRSRSLCHRLRRQRHQLLPAGLVQQCRLLGCFLRCEPECEEDLRRARHRHDLPPPERSSGQVKRSNPGTKRCPGFSWCGKLSFTSVTVGAGAFDGPSENLTSMGKFSV